MSPRYLLLLLPMLHASPLRAATPAGFEERFALAADRAAILTELIQGTPEFYYYSALHAQNSGQSAEVARLLREWADRYPDADAKRSLLETRQHFLDYSTDPAATLAWLRDAAGLTFQHARETAGTPPEIPTALDPALITWEAFYARAVQQDPLLSTLTDSGLRSLFQRGLALGLPAETRRAVLSRLNRPDLPDLTAFILADLKTRQSQGFGEFPIHRLLLTEQLESLQAALPALLGNQAFVETRLARLAPPDGADPDRDPAVRLAWLERLEAFALTLPPAFNSIRAAVLYQRLDFDLTKNTVSRDRLLAYLQLPRPVVYLSKSFREQRDLFQNQADLNLDLSTLTGHGPIRQDDDLVRRCLLRLLAENPDTAPFQPWIEASFLNALLAEAKLTADPASAEQFVSLLPPAAYQELRTRTDLEFDPSCRESWLPSDEVSLDLHIKNIPRLLIKVFEINTENVHRSTGRQVNTDLDLDGLVANQEISQDYSTPPLQRVRRTFTFPQLNGKRGVWIIEFIGGGKSSRALVRKGGLTVIPVPTGAGVRLTVLDEKSAPVPSAYALLGSQRFAADDKGRLLLPFSTTPGEQQVIIGDGSGFTTLEPVTLPGESYSLNAGFHVPRESLLPGNTATVLLRPALLCNGLPTTLSALENAKLTLTATTLDGIPSTTVFPLQDLSPDKESAVNFQVPDRLDSLYFSVTAEVKSLLTGEPLAVAASDRVMVNGISRTTATSDLHLTPGPDGWTLSELGRTGEPLADRQISVSAVHRDFTNSPTTSLRTRGDGSVLLGDLSELATLTAANSAGLNRIFPLPRDNATFPASVQFAAGEPVRLAWPWTAPDAAALPPGSSLLEFRGNAPFRAITDGIRITGGILEITGLEPGSYSLFLSPKFITVAIRIAAGKVVESHLVNDSSVLELTNPAPLAITGLTPGKITPKDAAGPVDALTIHIAHATPDTRVQVLVSRFLPEFDAFAALSPDSLPSPLQADQPFRPSLYQSARTIGEEYRYVLERRSQQAYAGNFLTRPGLLLNPWAIADTTTERQDAAPGEAPAPMVAERRKAGAPAPASPALGRTVSGMLGDSDKSAPPATPDLSFLAEPGAIAFNLKPGADGNVSIAAAALGHGRLLRVIALSGDSAAVRDFTLPDKPLKTRDLRLANGLDPAGHFTRQNTVTVIEKDAPFLLNDPLSSRFQSYGTLGSAWDLLYNLNKNPTLAEFSFLRAWPGLDPAAKRTLYSKYACHELSFFLSRKDPEFFRSVIVPYLVNKRDRTFLDEYLLGADLTPWLALPRYTRLNTAEQVLLARRLEGTLSATARDLTDFLKTRPVSPDKEVFWFESALGGGGLVTDLKNGKDKFSNLNQSNFYSLSTADAAAGGIAAPEPATAAVELGVVVTDSAVDGLAVGKESPRSRGVRQEESLLRESAKQQALYRQTELTKEWAENNYYQLLIADQNAGLIQPNRFWQDYALWDGKSPFLSAHLSEAANSFTEILLALAVLDLPMDSDARPGKSEFKDGILTLTPSSRTLLFHQEIKPADPDKESPPLLVSQNFYREGDRFVEENGEKTDKFITGEFLTGTVYGCQTVVTNPTSSRRKLEVLFQIPVGAIPVRETRVTQSIPLQLDGFRTQTLDFHFYFPAPGEFAHYPVHISRDGKVSASADSVVLTVVDTLSTLDKNSWDYLSQQGTGDEVLTYLRDHNLHQTDLDRIAWRLKDRAFYDQVVTLLRARKHWHPTTFSYGLLHNDLPAVRDYLAMQPPLVSDPLDSPILTIDPVEQKTFQWLEYSPLVNARAHQLGSQRTILNDRFRAQYDAFLHLLTFRAGLGEEDKLGITAALLLQDRIAEAIATFSQVNRDAVHEQLQYDYLQGWLALSTEDPATARRIASAHTGKPLPDHWLAKFQEMASQLDEIEGKPSADPQPGDRDAAQDRLAAREPQFNVKIENKAITLDYRNLTEITVNYYPMDLEFLFSANPFVGRDTGRFGMIRPNRTERLTLAPDQTVRTFPLPQAWQNTNVLVEITAAGQTRSVASYANQLDVQISENYGQLQVRHAGDRRPLPRTYIKVFAEINGSPVFYKDGYTDLRGKFDYTSLSTDDLDRTTRFSILILTQDHGATVREVKPPAR